MLWVMAVLANDNQCDYEPAPEFTWEGELDPNAFDAWEIFSVQRASDPLIIMSFISNPDKTAAIKTVVLLIAAFEGDILAYRYFKEGQPYQYVHDGKGKYVEKKLTLEERKGCMKCHRDQLIQEEAT
jgi:hypothetical protein